MFQQLSFLMSALASNVIECTVSIEISAANLMESKQSRTFIITDNVQVGLHRMYLSHRGTKTMPQTIPDGETTERADINSGFEALHTLIVS